MIITDNYQQESYFESIIDSGYPMVFSINQDGQLVANNYWTSDFYIAYFRGNWYASNNEKKGSSQESTYENLQLFAYADKLYMEYLGNGRSEVSGSKMPLDKDTHSFLIYCHKMALVMVVADGSKTDTVIISGFRATRDVWRFLFISLCAMIRQHDAAAAEEIEAFWAKDKEDPVLDPSKVIKPNIFEKEISSHGP